MPTSLDDDLAALFSFRFPGDPYDDLFERVRAEGPAYRTPDRVVVSHFDAARLVYRDAAVFANGGGTATVATKRILAELPPEIHDFLIRVFEYEAPTLVRNNGPMHQRMRSVMQRTFTPGRLNAMRDDVERLAAELLDELDTTDGFELMSEFAYRLPLLVILEIMGVPREHEATILGWAQAIGANRNGVVADRIEPAYHAFVEFNAYIHERIQQQLSGGTNHLFATMVDAREAGTLSTEEVTANVINLLFAGHETTANLIGNGVWAMLSDRAQWQLLVDDIALAPRAAEEVLRFQSPVQYNSRMSVAPATIGNVEIEPGTQVMPMAAAANRDPAQFAHADRLDITREAIDHVAFGLGVHHCLGAFLARIEGEVAFRQLAIRFPDLALKDRPVTWRANRNIRGLERLDLTT